MSPVEKELAKKLISSLSDDNLINFEILMNNKTLTKKDSKGVSVLENLNKIVMEVQKQKC